MEVRSSLSFFILTGMVGFDAARFSPARLIFFISEIESRLIEKLALLIFLAPHPLHPAHVRREK
jgi:hypothetical protein